MDTEEKARQSSDSITASISEASGNGPHEMPGRSEKEFVGTRYAFKMMMPMALSFLAAFRGPRGDRGAGLRAMVRLTNASLKASWRRMRCLKKPWSPTISFEEIRPISNIDPAGIQRRNERYLRSNWGCDPYDPVVAALAEDLGVHELSKKEFAERAYDFAKNRVRFAMEYTFGGVRGTLKAGCGDCFHKDSLLIALARYAGIPARYCFLALRLVDPIARATQPQELGLDQSIGYLTGHGYVELYLDGRWMACEPTWDEELEVGMDIPIARFGMNPEGIQSTAVPGTKVRFEGFPLLLIVSSFFYTIQNRGMCDIVNLHLEELRKKGRDRLNEIGRDQYIELKKRLYIPAFPNA